MKRTDEHPLLQGVPKSRILCFTGHRPEKLPTGEILQILTETLHYYIDIAISQGYTHFLTGLADGVDYLAAEYLFTLRRKHPDIRVIGVQPCEDYREFFRVRGYSLPRLEFMLREADGLVVLPGSYKSYTVFQKRNYYMVDRAAALIAVCGNGRSGSMQTFNYAARKGLAYCRIYVGQNPDLPAYRTLTPEKWVTQRSGF